MKYRKTTKLEKKVLNQLGFEIQEKVRVITKEERELLEYTKKIMNKQRINKGN